MGSAVAVIDRRAVGALGEAPTVLPGDTMFRFDPPVSQETIRGWQRELDRYFEPQDRISRLVVRWESGDIWQPIQRFLIWQCENPNTIAVPPLVQPGFRGPHPRSTGHYCAPGHCLCPVKRNAWRSGANRYMDRATYELWKETGLWGRRWWTVQGHKGGHRFQWDPNELEAKLSQMQGGPVQTPSPGELPYAPLDGRVFERVAAMDKVKHWTKAIDYASRHVDHLTREEADDAVKAREALWSYIDWGIDEAWDLGGSALKQYLRQTVGRAKVGESYRGPDEERIERHFMHKNFD